MPEPPRLEDIVTHRELAEFLGITERALSSQRIPHITIATHRLYFRSTVAEWLKGKEEGRRG